MARNNRILIVEDDDLFSQLLHIALAKEGYEVRIVQNGRTALESLPCFQPHLICLDLYLPEVNGWEVLHELSSSAQCSSAIIVFSARRVDRTSLLGVSAFFQKPLHIPSLLHHINGLMSQQDVARD